MNRSEEVKTFIREKGAHIVGVSSVDRFKGAPKGHNPSDLLPNARSVVTFGMRFFQSSLEGDRFCVDSELVPKEDLARLQEQTGFMFEYTALNMALEILGLQLAYYLTENGYKALPLPAGGATSAPAGSGPGGGFPGGRYAAFSHRHAAVLAGLGVLGLNNLLITPKYGPRVRINSVITDAELTPDPMIPQEKVCPAEKCMICVKPIIGWCYGELYELELGEYTYKIARYYGCHSHMSHGGPCKRGGSLGGKLPYLRWCIGSCPVGKDSG